MSMRKVLVAAAPATALAVVLALASTAFAQQGPNLGKPISQEDLASWDISIGPDGVGLPSGSGTVKQGEATFMAKCQPCHNEKGAGQPNDRLVGGQGSLPGDKPPVKTVGSFWPYATTLFDYIRRAMPMDAPATLSSDEIYAVSAYLLYLNQIVGLDDRLDPQSLPRIRMPNRDGFIGIDADLPGSQIRPACTIRAAEHRSSEPRRPIAHEVRHVPSYASASPSLLHNSQPRRA